MAASVMMGWLGTVPLAAHGIAIQLASISFMMPLGLSHAATVRIGQAYGRGDMDELARAAHTVMGLAVVISLLASGALFWIFPEALVSLFLDEANADAAELFKSSGAAGAGGRGVPAGRRGPGDCRGPSARHQGHPHADDHRGDQLLADRPVGGLRARLRPGLSAAPASGPASPSGSAWQRCCSISGSSTGTGIWMWRRPDQSS
jgi:hypothetical protein